MKNTRPPKSPPQSPAQAPAAALRLVHASHVAATTGASRAAKIGRKLIDCHTANQEAPVRRPTTTPTRRPAVASPPERRDSSTAAPPYVASRARYTATTGHVAALS